MHHRENLIPIVNRQSSIVNLLYFIPSKGWIG
jgi:hypothetical protein